MAIEQIPIKLAWFWNKADDVIEWAPSVYKKIQDLIRLKKTKGETARSLFSNGKGEIVDEVFNFTKNISNEEKMKLNKAFNQLLVDNNIVANEKRAQRVISSNTDIRRVEGSQKTNLPQPYVISDVAKGNYKAGAQLLRKEKMSKINVGVAAKRTPFEESQRAMKKVLTNDRNNVIKHYKKIIQLMDENPGISLVEASAKSGVYKGPTANKWKVQWEKFKDTLLNPSKHSYYEKRAGQQWHKVTLPDDPEIKALALKMQKQVKRAQDVQDAKKLAADKSLKISSGFGKLPDISMSGIWQTPPGMTQTKLASITQRAKTQLDKLNYNLKNNLIGADDYANQAKKLEDKINEGIKQGVSFDFPIEGEHQMELWTKKILQDAGLVDIAKKYKMASAITTPARNKIKSRQTDIIQKMLLDKDEAIKSGMPTNELITLFSGKKDKLGKTIQTGYDEVITEATNKLDEIGVNTAVWNPNKGRVEIYGTAFDTPTKLRESVKTLQYEHGGLVNDIFDPKHLYNGGDAELEVTVPLEYDIGTPDPVYEDVDEIDYIEEQQKMMGKKFSYEDTAQTHMSPAEKVEFWKGVRFEPIAKWAQKKKNVLESNLSENAKSHLKTMLTVKEWEDIWKEKLNEAQKQATDKPELWANTLKARKEFYESDAWKEATASLWEPHREDQRNEIKKELDMYNLKKLGLNVTDFAIDKVLKYGNPIGWVSMAGEHLFQKEAGTPSDLTLEDGTAVTDDLTMAKFIGERNIANIDVNEDGINDYLQSADIMKEAGLLTEDGVLSWPEKGIVSSKENLLWKIPPKDLNWVDYSLFGGTVALSFLGAGFIVNNTRNAIAAGAPIRAVRKLLGEPTKAELKAILSGMKWVAWKGPKKLGKGVWEAIQSKTNKETKNIRKAIEFIISKEGSEKIKRDEEKFNKLVAEERKENKYQKEREVFFKSYVNKMMNIKSDEPSDATLWEEKQDEKFENIPNWVREMAKDDADKYLDSLDEKGHIKKESTPKDFYPELYSTDIFGSMGSRMEEPKKMSFGGDPLDDVMVNTEEMIQTPPTIDTAKDSIFMDDQSYEVAQASIFGKVPGWAIAGVDKVDDLLRTGASVTNRIRIGEKVADAAASSGEKINKFYSNIEAKLLDPSAPKIFEQPADLFNWLNAKGISKAEVEDYMIPQLLESMKKLGQPLTKEMLLERIKVAPIRKLEAKTFGFRSDKVDGEQATAKYGDQHMEKGYIPGSYRENVVYIDPKNIPKDIKVYKHSVHDFFPAKDKYVVGWSRLSDRNAIIPAEKAITDITQKTQTLEKKIDRLTNITNMTPDEMATKHNISREQAVKNIANAEKEIAKAVKQLENVGVPSGAAQGEDKIIVTFADEIQSDILQQYAKQLQKVKEEYKLLTERGIKPSDRGAIEHGRYGDDGVNINTDTDVMAFYDKYKNLFRPVFRTSSEFMNHIKDLQKSHKVFQELAEIRPGMLTPQMMSKVKEASVARDKVLSIFEEAQVSPKVLEKLFPNVPFKDRKLWGDALVKNDLHNAAYRLFVEKDAAAPTWYAISPDDLIISRYTQKGNVATPFAERTKDMKGIGTSEFYGGPNANTPDGKHFTSILEQALRRAANANNSEVKIIKVAVGNPTKKSRIVRVISTETGNTVKEFKVTRTGGDDAQTPLNNAMKKAQKFIEDSQYENLDIRAVEIPSGFKTVDAYAIKLTPEMVLPSKTHLATGGYVHNSPLVPMEEVIGTYAYG